MKYLKYYIIIGLVMIMAGCASSRQNPYAKKRKSNSHVSTTQLGRNKYFFSKSYQNKLKKSYKNK
ncbi:MAG: hypothetical protein E4G95_05080 [Bacteroidia bacterium]|nr:MAG: hypothetical protein E4G95_05080 [Bacteroidia bacterium]